jgi:hypothetical protein
VHRPVGQQPQDGAADRAATSALTVAVAMTVVAALSAGVGHESHSSSHEVVLLRCVHDRPWYRCNNDTSLEANDNPPRAAR